MSSLSVSRTSQIEGEMNQRAIVTLFQALEISLWVNDWFPLLHGCAVVKTHTAVLLCPTYQKEKSSSNLPDS